MELTYRIAVNTPEGPWENSGTVKGFHKLLRLHLTLPEGQIASVTASLPLAIDDDEKIFMNGFQTWTYCPEYGRRDRIRSLRRLPKQGVRYFGLDRYGDEHFLYYPDKPGQTHGESWCYFRRGKHFRLLGSLDERPGYTIFRYDAKKGVLSLSNATAPASSAAAITRPSIYSMPRAVRTRYSTAGLPRWGYSRAPASAWPGIRAGKTAIRTSRPSRSRTISTAALRC